MHRDYFKEDYRKKNSNWKREKLLLRNTKYGEGLFHKEEGNLGVVVSMFFLLFVVVLFSYQLYLTEIIQAGRMVEDALMESELAAAVIDLQELGRTGQVRFTDVDTVYSNFAYHMRNNLELDAEGNSKYSLLAAGPIQIEDFRVYEVTDGGIREYDFGNRGHVERQMEWDAEEVTAPDGTVIEETSIYASCTFYVRGMNQSVLTGKKEKTVDIKKTEN